MNTKRRVAGLTDSARAWYSRTLLSENPHLLVICSDETAVEQFIQDFRFFCPERPAMAFPAWGMLPFEMISPDPAISAARTHVQLVTTKQSEFCIVASVQGLIQRTVPVAALEPLSFSLRTDTEYDRDKLIEQFLTCGYKRVSLVEQIGEIAIRGNIIDYFPAGTSRAVRLEFFDTLLEKIKTFDPRSQRSTGRLDRATVQPVSESYPFKAIGNKKKLDAAIENLKTQAAKAETPAREVAKSISALRDGILVPGYELLSFIGMGTSSALLSCLPADTLCILNNEIECSSALSVAHDHITERHARLTEQHYLIPDQDVLYVSPRELHAQLEQWHQLIFGSTAVLESPELSDIPVDRISTLAHTHFGRTIQEKLGSGHAYDTLQAAVRRWQDTDLRIAFIVGSEGRARRLEELLRDLGIHVSGLSRTYAEWETKSEQRGTVEILLGHLEHGFSCPAAGFVLISENEVFARKSYRTGQRQQKDLKQLLSSLGQLSTDDYVVHEDYGIGIYRGLTHLVVEGSEGDFVHIEYADSTLYLPAHNISKIQKYIGAEGAAPQLDKLSSQKWAKTKEKVREAVLSLAGELISLYAARSVAEGFAFESDTRADEQFADSFPFDETPDQLTAIQETFRDMASERPMDRLICGDVGFGKTEVAIRAAHKCIQSNKQVAILVPTTILVEQHTNSFLERFRGRGLTIRAMSRFYSRKENLETTAGLADGSVDIVIGTHKLLSKKLEFYDLGLLIIDEEHRFGVKQKEQLKQFKKKVDVLTMTATPIPRTLHMAMLNIRDISIISTPPTDRRVIKTYLAQRNDVLVRDALMREYQRGGQSFFLHNRVETIGSITAGLHELCPELRFEYAHGQMTESQLENIMQRFLNHEIDVLVCTTIIESGIDISNANTILIDRADMFGLAQLYQIRGRVGRSTRQAYCYFLIPPIKRLGGEAQQRLKALQALDDLGQGFHLALRDLEIRGAGNLLGREQSGNVFSVGYDLYTKILNETVTSLKGETLDLRDSIDPDIRIKSRAFIPEYYIPDISERLMLYQRLTALQDLDEAHELQREIEDRFGAYGEEIENLLILMHIRILCKICGVVQLDKIRDRSILSFAKNAPINIERILQLVRTSPDTYRLTSNQSLSVPWERGFDSLTELYRYLEVLLQRITTVQAAGN